uniref:Angiotensin-converting enzyme 2 n=1 Tax=Populus davidiana TaxID=266767 RepID=A0A6M2EA06_9ROSI
MSSGPVRRVLPKDIQVVQNLIERCLQLYMNQNEVVETLLAQAKIEPGFTELVWQKLEEENREFFRAYYLRLKVKQQIEEFNKLLVQQAHLMRDLNSTGVVSMPTSNGSHIPPRHQNTACYGPDHTGPTLKPESMHHPIGSSLTNAYTNGGSSLHSSMHAAVEIAARSSRIDAPPNMLSMQSSNIGLLQGMNGGMIKSEAGYSGTSPYMFGADGNVLEARPSIADASVASFSSVESSSQALNESILDADTSSFGFLSQIPRNFSLSDLTADFTQSSEILENYPRSPYLAADNDNYPDSQEREHPGDNRRLDTISEGMSYDDFGSE